MKLCQITVNQLFYDYDYSFDLFTEEYVTILHGVNGVGKTTLFRLITAISELDLCTIMEIPFHFIELKGEGGFSLKVSVTGDTQWLAQPLDTISSSPESSVAVLLECSGKAAGHDTSFRVPIGEISAADPQDLQELRNQAALRSTGGATPVISLLTNAFFARRRFADKELLKKYLALEKFIKSELKIFFIEASRIFKYSINEHDEKKADESVLLYAADLRGRICALRSAKEQLTEQLDQTFPKRVMENCHQFREKNLPVYEELKQKYAGDVDALEKAIGEKYDQAAAKLDDELGDIKRLREKLCQLGISNEADPGNEDFDILPDMIPMIEVYLADSRRKLSIYFENDNFYKRAFLFLSIINNQYGFTNKELRLDPVRGITCVTDKGRIIPLDRLSSGEKNKLCLYYELIFCCSRNSIILIDEPEISLHIDWQEEYIKYLIEICRMNNLQAIVATHSPSIVQDHPELMIEINAEE